MCLAVEACREMVRAAPENVGRAVALASHGG